MGFIARIDVGDLQHRVGLAGNEYAVPAPLIREIAGSGCSHEEGCVAATSDRYVRGLRGDVDVGLCADEGDLANAATWERVVAVERLVDVIQVAIDRAHLEVE